jgi:uncharacterized membrane protein
MGALLALTIGGWAFTRGGSPGVASLWLGRFHPVVVHLPIGFLIALVLLELCALRRGEGVGTARWVLLWGTCAGSALSVVLGFCLAREGGWEEKLLDRHLWLGAALAVLCMALVAARLAFERRGGAALGRLYASGVAACVGLLVWTGHAGGSLTHGPGYLTEYLSAAPAGVAKEEAEPPEFERDVRPILRARCEPCHGPAKQEGKLRLDSAAEILEGGESQRPAVLPGDLAGSYVVELITRPRGRKGAMPPQGAPDLTRHELRTIVQWIHLGARGLKKE